MKMYAKIINEQKLCEVGLGTNTEFYKFIGMERMEVEQAYDGNWYLKGYAPTQPLDELKQAKLDEVNAWTKSKITGGFVCYCYNNEPVLYDTDEETQLTMTKARANCQSEKFQANFPTGMPCRGYVKVSEDEEGKDVFDTEKTILFFTPEQIISWDEDFSLFLSKCKGEGWVKQAEVEACTTKEELDAIVLD